jgi:MFS transporter, DHA2 family, multidrug resistance protein
VLSFGGFFQSIRLFGGELGASFVQFFLHHRQVFHYDLLASGIERGAAPVVLREHLLIASMHAKSTATDVGLGRSAELLAGSVKQQAFTLATMDSFTLIAYAATGCLVIVLCLHPLKTGFKQLIAAATANKLSS